MKKIMILVLLLMVSLSSVFAVSLVPFKGNGYWFLKEDYKMSMYGDKYNNGLITRRAYDDLHYGQRESNSFVFYKLDSKYRALKCTIGVQDDKTLGSVEFIVDQKQVAEIKLSGDWIIPEDYEIDLKYGQMLKIVLHDYVGVVNMNFI